MVRIRSLLDNLTFAVSLVGVLPVYLYLDLPAQVIFPMALLLGAWCDRRERYFFASRGATILSLLVFAFYALQINRSTLVEPALNVAVLLLAVRLLTEKEGRHFLQIFLLSGFALAGSSLLTLSLAFLPLMVLLVIGIVGGLVLLCFYSDDPRMALDRAGFSRLLRMALLLPTGALLLAIFFFFILPRTQHPLWDFLNPGGAAKVGFSEEVSPGSFASTVADDSVAFRVEAVEMDPNELYWRVTVLDTLEGSTWKRSYAAAQGSPAVVGGTPVALTVFPEAGQGKFLATLDSPVAIQGVYNRRRTDGVFRYYRTAKRPQSYHVEARLNGELQIDRKEDRAAYLQLPEGIAPRARQTARELVAATSDQLERTEKIKQFFRQQQLVYATENLPTGGDSIDTFLFDSKRGYCEYFASAFAVMLREAGIPARLVGGYLGGSFNEIGNYYTIGERTAHVWVEALNEAGVWERMDPNLYAVNAEGSLLARSRQRPLGWQQFSDAIDYYWTQAVITFDFARQLEFAKAARDKFRDWRQGKSSFKLSAPVILIPLLPVLLVLILLRKKSKTIEERLLQHFTGIIRRQVGSDQLPPTIGLNAMARRAATPQAREFVQIYSGAVYRDRALRKEEVTQLKRLLGEMRKAG